MKTLMTIIMAVALTAGAFANETAPETQPALSNDPAVLRKIISEQQEEIASLKAQVAKLMGGIAPTQAKDAFPSIAGVWQEVPGILVTVVQTNGDWKAGCSYKIKKTGEVRWEMTGTITRDGKIQGRLQHTKAPPSWARSQVREGKLSDDGSTISGIATWENVGHPFTWTKHDGGHDDAQVVAGNAAAPDEISAEIKAAIAQKTLAIGMTLDQCNKSIGMDGRVTGADASGATGYEWYQAVGRDYLGNAQATIRYTGVIADGKLISFQKEPPQARNVGVGRSSIQGQIR